MDAAAGLDGEVAPDVGAGPKGQLVDRPARRLEAIVRVLARHAHRHHVPCARALFPLFRQGYCVCPLKHSAFASSLVMRTATTCPARAHGCPRSGRVLHQTPNNSWNKFLCDEVQEDATPLQHPCLRRTSTGRPFSSHDMKGRTFCDKYPTKSPKPLISNPSALLQKTCQGSAEAWRTGWEGFEARTEGGILRVGGVGDGRGALEVCDFQ